MVKELENFLVKNTSYQLKLPSSSTMVAHGKKLEMSIKFGGYLTIIGRNLTKSTRILQNLQESYSEDMELLRSKKSQCCTKAQNGTEN